jgi:murein DD-endopeptidase MepM/ murein hydrolase activator NlpD
MSHINARSTVELGSLPIKIPKIEYGLVLDTFLVETNKVKFGQNLGSILYGTGISMQMIDELVKKTKDSFDFTQFKAGQTYKVFKRDSNSLPSYFVYESSISNAFVFNLTANQLGVKKFEKPVRVVLDTIYGEITSSLWNSIVDRGSSIELASKLEDAYQWSIDFYHLQKGDQFKAVFENLMIDDQPIGVGKLWAASFEHEGNDFYAIYFENDTIKGYFDLEGRPMKKSFLKSPIKYARISSRYNLSRFHPILKRVRPHLGTDYAAPYGTPIYAIGDGIISEAAYTKGNGNYIKIRHNNTYQTQYLHMQKFAAGIKRGSSVQQGQVIGYVGSTGLATGPHVCFRFWKNGRQVNHLNLSFPPPAPLDQSNLESFYITRDKVIEVLTNQPSACFYPASEENDEEKFSPIGKKT